ncbi:MAG: hypothetical protein AB4062_21495 [Crocosphaera sp.]
MIEISDFDIDSNDFYIEVKAKLEEIYREQETCSQYPPNQILCSAEIPEKSKAKEIIKNNYLRQYICKFLPDANNDIFELAKMITPALIIISSNANNNISIPYEPLIYAWIIFLIFKTGIKNFCSNDNEGNQ